MTEFVMVSVLLVFLLFAVLQVAAILYIRSIVAAAASDGARFGANAGSDPSAGGPRATDLVSRALGDAMATRIPCSAEVTQESTSGLSTERVRCRGDIRSIFLPIGALVNIDAVGESLREQP